MEIDGILMIALQVYSPPCDVRRGLNVRLWVVVLPDVTIALRVKVDPPSTSLPLEYSHCMVGTTTRCSTTVAVQLRVYISPVVVLLVLWMATSGTGRASILSECALLPVVLLVTNSRPELGKAMASHS